MDLLNRGCQSLFRLFVRINTCVVSLSVLAYLVCQPVTAAIHTFSEVRSDRASWTKFGAIVVVGVVLLVAVIWLLGKSTAILF
ncbi:TIGR03745 family integrating conjugative element membrane protein [Photorhabdus laumondii subsp. clarkei]|uniref:TIGR03745 family integrating conjugative element membrane protein n=2 Tax=Photorhabdus TaxID=29487 RepID=A0A329VL33_9GAMM|nr:TIGR03745 family integrating conjugative element membrane protein [Photorhabdus laumondii]RAW91737.1 TIGR03745 family integrating conjugative element membrane protein [Photorhabdus laumondii subsp. clarkei]